MAKMVMNPLVVTFGTIDTVPIGPMNHPSTTPGCMPKTASLAMHMPQCPRPTSH